MTATQPVDREALRRKTAPLLLCERARSMPDSVAFRAEHLGLYRERGWRDYAALVARAARNPILEMLAESLLDVAMNFGFHLEHACGGSCACTTCHVVVKEGGANLSEMEDDELDRVEQAADYQLHSRLGCQAVVKGDVKVHIPEWNRNYVSEGH